jgi:uncharacterized protein (TIGR02145 family)
MKKYIASFILFLFILNVYSQEEIVRDIDGNIYHTVKIGDQIWLKENLRTTHFRNGDPIPTTKSLNQDVSSEEKIKALVVKDLSTPAYPTNHASEKDLPAYQWAYNGDEALVAVYGRLYTWYAANDSRKLAPEGWHVASDVEWLAMIEFLGSYSVSGGKMKEVGNNHWAEPNTGATNESGFTALGAGGRNVDGIFSGLTKYGAWWTAPPLALYNLKSFALFRHIEHDDPYTYRNYNYNSKVSGFSVRCIKD